MEDFDLGFDPNNELVRADRVHIKGISQPFEGDWCTVGANLEAGWYENGTPKPGEFVEANITVHLAVSSHEAWATTQARARQAVREALLRVAGLIAD